MPTWKVRDATAALIALAMIGGSWPADSGYPAFVGAALADDDADGGDDGGGDDDGGDDDGGDDDGGDDGGDDRGDEAGDDGGYDTDSEGDEDRRKSARRGGGENARPDDRRRTRLGRLLDDLTVSRVTPPEDRGRDYYREEVAALGITRAEATALTGRGFSVLFQTPILLLEGRTIARLSLPPNISLEEGVALAREIAPNALFDLNHLYRPLAGACESGRCYGATLVGYQDGGTACAVRAPIGLIDTGVDAGHPALAGARITQAAFHDKGRSPASFDHGTAVASLLVGEGDVTGPLAPGAEIFAADVFHREGEDVSASAVGIVRGLDWVVRQGARVVNLSLMGSQNALLAEAAAAAAKRGVVLVAAAGNGGPNAAPAYPAALPDVIAVSAVDQRGRAYSRANRGDFVEFSGPGVEIWAAGPRNGAAYWTGTSFAAPFVAAAVAQAMDKTRVRDVEAARELLIANARDLGPKGRDPVFGWGLVRLPEGGC